MTSRQAGMVGAALSSTSFAGIICDGHHVSDPTLAVALSAGDAKDRLFFVSDAMPTIGGPDSFSLHGMDIRLQDGKLVNPEGNLAGAHVTMADSMRRAISCLGLNVEQVLHMGITIPNSVIDSPDHAQVLGCRLDELLHWSETLSQCQWLSGDKFGCALENQRLNP